MPITWITFLIGSLALIGTPFFSGFYSKDSIIEAVSFSHIPGSGFAYFSVLAGVFVTAFYSFRLYFLVFHGKERFGKAHEGGHDSHGEHHGLAPGQKPHETPWTVWVPLVLLAIPSVFIGYFTIEPLLVGDYFKSAIYVDTAAHGVMAEYAEEFHGALTMGLHAFTSLEIWKSPFWLALAGVALSWFLYLKRPDIPACIQQRFSGIYTLLENKYYFDKFYETVFAGGARLIGRGLWKGGDAGIIDGLIVSGSVRVVSGFASLARLFQSGHIYQYAFMMIFGVCAFLSIWFIPPLILILRFH
jgi:NADH-quinone oxidoreductase subunit L